MIDAAGDERDDVDAGAILGVVVGVVIGVVAANAERRLDIARLRNQRGLLSCPIGSCSGTSKRRKSQAGSSPSAIRER